MSDAEIKVNFNLDTAQANKELDAMAARLESVRAAVGGAGGNATAPQQNTEQDTQAWQANDEVKKLATATADALNEAEGRLTETVKLETAETVYNTQAWQDNIKAQVSAMAGTEGAAERINAIADAQGRLATANENATIAWRKAVKPTTDYTASLELQTKTYAELLEMQEDLLQARAAATSAEEVQELDRMLGSVRKNMRMVGAEAKSSGAQIIGSQRTVQGAFSATLRLWRQGRLTLKGLTDGMKMFAKSTFFLAAIQLAWELLVNVWEKGKESLLGTADAAEKAKEEQEKLATAAREAADNLLAAQDALANARRDKERKDAAEEFKRQIKEQNDEYQRQIKLVDEATAAQLRQLAMTAKEDERKAAMEKLMLQQELMAGKITEYEYQERLIRLENKAQQAQYERATKQKKIAYNAAKDEESAAEKNRILTEKMQKKDMSGFEMDIASVAEKVARWRALKTEQDEKRTQYVLGKVEEEMLLGILNYGGNTYEENLKNPHIETYVKEAKKKLDELQPFLQRYEKRGQEATEAYSSVPEFVRKLGMNEFAVTQYVKEKEGREAYNANVQSEIDKAIAEEQKAEEAVRKAEREYNEAVEDNVNAAIHAGQVAQMRIDMTHRKEQDAKKDAENAKRIQRLQNEVGELEFSVLKQREAELRAEANATPEGKRKGRQADVYLRELERRRERGRDARERVEFAGRGGSQAERDIVELAGKAASRAARTQTVDLERAAQILKQAEATRGKADDAAAIELYNVIEKLYTVEQANSRQARSLEQRYKRLAAKVAKDA